MAEIVEKEMEKARTVYENSIQSITSNPNGAMLGTAVINYMNMQINESSRMGYINQQQYRETCARAVEGLHNLIYIDFYTKGEELLNKRPIYLAAFNYLMIMFTRIQGGKDRIMHIEGLRATQPVTIQRA